MLTIFEVIDKNDKEEIELFLKQNPSILRSVDSNGISPLLYSLYTGKMEIAELMYSKGQNFTIHECIGFNDFQKVKDLLEKDISLLNQLSKDGWTPLHLACFWGKNEIVNLLLDKGANIDYPSKSKASFGNSPLQAAIAMQQEETIKLLISRGANVNFLQLPGNYTPLHIAASRKNENILQMLLNAGANINIKTEDGKLPVDIARERNMEKSRDLLEKFTS